MKHTSQIITADSLSENPVAIPLIPGTGNTPGQIQSTNLRDQLLLQIDSQVYGRNLSPFHSAKKGGKTTGTSTLTYFMVHIYSTIHACEVPRIPKLRTNLLKQIAQVRRACKSDKSIKHFPFFALVFLYQSRAKAATWYPLRLNHRLKIAQNKFNRNALPQPCTKWDNFTHPIPVPMMRDMILVITRV